MATDMPKPAPVKPKPITHDPHHGQLQVVISFRVSVFAPIGPKTAMEYFHGILGAYMLRVGWKFEDLDVAVRVIGDGGEASEDEGRYDQPTLTEDVERRSSWRDRTDVDTGGKL